ncbi:hypothetical protein L1887_35026 [Cichorium endivia]|nr:hypothetical protein L1887_35026 [Cichorium endivia]
MAKIIHSVFVIFLVFNIMITISMAGRDIPDKNLKKPEEDVKHPETFYFDRGYLIPGVGRGIKPKSKKGFNPFTYNPITGRNDGIPGLTVPSGGGSLGGLGGGSYLPGGDDTLVPNPGVEVPNPVSGGSIPSPDSP